MNSYIEFKPLDVDESKNLHSFQIRCFFKPILCIHCSDYIWGEGFIGYSCLNCSKCVHTKCKLFASQFECNHEDTVTIDKISRNNLYPVENWSINTVKEWLAVVNLHRYAEVFATYYINGVKLLGIDIYQLNAFRIRDSYHHAAILQARDELIQRSKINNNIQQVIIEQNEAKNNLLQNQYKIDHHHFLLHTISKLTDCSMCKRPLLGILHQGLQCQKCGLITHKQCAHLGLPECKSNPQMKRKNVFFGANLLDLMSEDCEAPKILVKLFKNIEDRAVQNHEDLYDVYRLSADSSKIEKIKDFLDENGVELINFDSYDLNTVAALVKTFLKDLQDTVIPEFLYEMFIENVSQLKTDEFKRLVNENLHPINFRCLKFIMSHIIRVWTYQHTVKGCHYLPEKLFHIFRSILLRPEWTKITQIVYNIDSQTKVIQRLILEIDWGVPVPEYKVRPKRPANPVETDFSPQTAACLKSMPSDGINENQWFWGDINRDETYLILKNCPDGSFLVRNSTDKNSDSPYTLCVIKSSLVKSIKIFRQEQPNGSVYDIEKPCRFESVSSLVSYYSRVSLKEYNHNLNLVLTYGVSKYKFGKTTQWSIDKLYSSFRDAFQQYEQLTKKYENLETEVGNVKEDLGSKKLAIEAFDKIIEMYMSQIDQVNRIINDNLYKKTNAISTTRLLASQLMPISRQNQGICDDEITQLDNLMKQNKEKLEFRVKEFHVKKEKVKNDVDYLSTVMGQLQEEIDLLRPELIELRKKRENYHMWLVQRGENDDKIQNNLKNMSKLDLSESFESTSRLKSSSSVEEYSSRVVDPHSNSLNWFIPECTRENAIEILKSKSNGTYLVRPNSKPNSKYILSLVCNDEVKHILIEENQSGCFIKSSFLKRKVLMNPSREEEANPMTTSSYSLNTSLVDDCKTDEELKFKTLTELIVFYSKNPIRLASLVLDTNLIIPVLFKSNDD